MSIFDKLRGNTPPNNATPAIVTEYDGVEFRSRLEAKWAVLFNQLGIRWQYEPYTIKRSGQAGYLPDFLLSGLGFYPYALNDDAVRGGAVYFEVKHKGYKPTGNDIRKWQVLRDRSHRFVIAFGMAYADGHGFFENRAGQILAYNKRMIADGQVAFYSCKNGHNWLDFWNLDHSYNCSTCGENGDTDEYDKAYRQAITYFSNHDQIEF